MAGSNWQHRWGRHDLDYLREQKGGQKNRRTNTGDACLVTSKLKTAVLGATGYSGLELVRLLAHHPHLAKPALLTRPAEAGTTEPDTQMDLAQLFPALSGDGGYPMEPFSWPALKQQGVELLFLATPHDVSRALVPQALDQGLRVIDLSGAWRLKQAQHRAIYNFKIAIL
jgi:N-acetyl-gamma-glutamyl-phosphate reductase